MKEYIQALKQYAQFSGRSSRKEFWMFALIHGILTFGFFVITMFLSLVGILLVSANQAISSLLYYGSITILVIYFFATLIPSLAITVRRLHDAGYPGKYVLFLLIPFVGPIILLMLTIQESKS